MKLHGSAHKSMDGQPPKLAALQQIYKGRSFLAKMFIERGQIKSRAVNIEGWVPIEVYKLKNENIIR